jgi:hypothetical protein
MIHNMRTSDIQRFQAKFRVTPGCWIWAASSTKNGYGQFALDGTMTGAHRASYLLHVGPIPEGAHVLHICDNKQCVNPAHLRAGTHKQNMQEASERDRFAIRKTMYKGIDNPRSKLTEDQVRSIRNDPRDTREIAAHYGLCRTYIYEIRRRLKWGHLR